MSEQLRPASSVGPTSRRMEGRGPHWSQGGGESTSRLHDAETSQLAARNLWKRYHKSRVEIPVLRGVDLDIREGEFLSIIGQSGSGKSTLLHLLGTLDAPDQGEVHFAGERIDNLP